MPPAHTTTDNVPPTVNISPHDNPHVNPENVPRAQAKPSCSDTDIILAALSSDNDDNIDVDTFLAEMCNKMKFSSNNDRKM